MLISEILEFTVLWQVVSIGSGPLSISMVQVLPVAPRRAAAAGRGAPDAARAAPSRRPGERVGREVRGRAAGPAVCAAAGDTERRINWGAGAGGFSDFLGE